MKNFRKWILSLFAMLLVSAILCTGATFAAELPEATMEIADDLAVTFTLEKSDVTGDGNYAVITHTYADGRGDTEKTILQEAWTQEETAYKFTYDAYAAKEMTDTLSIVVYDAAGTPAAQWTTTVRDIVAAQIAATSSQSRRALLEAMLEYGAAAQLYFDYAVDNLANKGLNADDSHLNAIRSQLESSRKDTSSLSGGDKSVVYGTSCILGNKLQMRVYFTDNTKQVLINGTEVQLQESNTEGYYYYEADVAPKEIFDAVTILVKDNDTIVARARDSVASYCARLYQQADEKSTALADAILTYGLAAGELKQEVSEPTVVGTYIYTGAEQTLVLDGFDDSYMTITGNTQVNAGSYEAVVTMNDNYEWANGEDGRIVWAIAQQELNVASAVISDKDANGVLDDAVVESIVFTGLQNGESLMAGEDYTVTAVYDTAEAGDSVPVTVTVNLLETDKTINYTLPNSTFQTNGKVIEPITDLFRLKFENTERYLYRVGNKNVVELGSLFDADDGAKLGAVAVEILPCKGTASGTYTANSDNWAKGKIQFSGTGVVKVTISGTYANPLELYLEVVDGYNVTTYSGGTYNLGNRNSVLLNDIEITENAQYKLTNATLHGNGFTFDVTAGMDSNTTGGNAYGNGTVILNSAKLDNIRIVGEVFLNYGQAVKDLYNFATVLVMGSSIIENSYISNGGAAVRVVNCTSLDLINTTLEGGIFANLDIRTGRVTLDNVVTINQSDASGKSTSADRKTEAEEAVVGLGIVMYDGAANVDLIVNKLTQHNNISSDVSSPSSEARSLVEALFSSAYIPAEFVHTDENNVRWINTGILSMEDSVGREQIIANDAKVELSYKGTAATIGGYNGYLYTPLRYESVKEAYASAGQGAIPPSYSFDYTTKNYEAKTDGSNVYCYFDKDTDTIQISFDEGSSKVYDPNILTVTKHNEKLDVAVSIGGVDYTGKTITFSEAGVYEILYTYTDPYHFAADAENGYVAAPKEYIKTRTVSVAAVAPTAKPAEFTFYGFSEEGTTPAVTITETKTVTASNGKTFVMPADTGDYVTAKTVDGVQVNCPVVHVDEYYNGAAKNDYNMLFPFFIGVTIKDYAEGGTAETATVIADQTTTTLPNGFEVITQHTPSPGWSANVVTSGESGSFGKISNGTYKGLYGAISGAISAGGGQKTHKASELVGQFSYRDNMGNTFYYCILFKIPERVESDNSTSSSCVAPETMITLADGTQKRVDMLDGSEQLLVWNLQTGALDAAPIMFVDSDAEAAYEVIQLQFSDGTTVGVISEHGFWDYDLNRYVYLDANAADYIGHSFAKQDGENLKKVQLTDVIIGTRVTTAWSPVTAGHLCYFVNGMLSMPGGVGGLFNFFEVDAETMTYDFEAMARDIETYGLYTYEELNAIAPLSENMFDAAGGAYLKVSIGKGNMTMDELVTMIERYSGFFGD